MKKASIKTDDQDIPELKPVQLGGGVRGKYLDQVTFSGNVIVLQPEIRNAIPMAATIDNAVDSILASLQDKRGSSRSTK